MAIQVNRGIITDGLVACFDAASPRSYTGTLPWVDLSAQCSNTTGVSPTYTGVNNGALAFDGINHYLGYKTNSALPNKITVEMWFKLTGSIADSSIFGFNSYAIFYLSNNFGYNTGAGDLYGFSSATFNSLAISGNWIQGIFVMNSDVSYTNNKIYINTSGQSLSQQAGSESAVNRTFNNGNGAIGSWLINQSYCTPMQCSIFRIYNRELSQLEINQNFEANRYRFSI